MANTKKVAMTFTILGKFCLKKALFRTNMLSFVDEKSCNKETNAPSNSGPVEDIDR